MLPFSTVPLESFAVRWQQRSFTAAGVPSACFQTTMSSPIRRKGLGPSSRADIGISAYQKRRSTFCLVVSMGQLLCGVEACPAVDFRFAVFLQQRQEAL